MNLLLLQGITMDTSSLLYNFSLSKKSLVLFSSIELLIILSLVFLGFRFALILALVPIFLFLNFIDVRINLLILFSFSTFVNYANRATLAFGLCVTGFILVFLLLAVYLKVCIRGFKMMKSKLNLPLSVFLAIVLLNCLRGLFLHHKIDSLALETFAYLCFGLIFLVINIFNSIKDIRIFFNISIFLAICLSIFGIAHYVMIGHRIGGTIYFGIIPGLVAIVLLNLFFYSKSSRSKNYYLLLSFVPILHLLFSFTRGYWLGFLGALIFSYGNYIFRQKYGITKKIPLLLKGGVVLAIIIFLLLASVQLFMPGGSFFNKVIHRFSTSFSVTYSPETISNVSRILEYQGAIEQIKKQPFWGHGISYGFELRDPLAVKTYTVRAVHNDYLAMILKMGLLGLGLFLWLFYVFFKNGLKFGRKLKDEYAQGLVFGFLANAIQLLIIGFTNHVFIEIMNTIYLAFVIGAVEVIKRGEEAIENTDFAGKSHKGKG
jgi:O-antigen ligase